VPPTLDIKKKNPKQQQRYKRHLQNTTEKQNIGIPTNFTHTKI